MEINQNKCWNLEIGTNKYSNIFVSKSCYERISEYIRIPKVDTNEYPNIFVSKKLTQTNIRIYSYPKSWHEWISEYIRIQKMIRTNIRINIWIKNIWIFEYSNIFVTLWCRATNIKSDTHVFSGLVSASTVRGWGGVSKILLRCCQGATAAQGQPNISWFYNLVCTFIRCQWVCVWVFVYLRICVFVDKESFLHNC